MNLLQTVADTLIEQGIVRNYSEFSRTFCNKTANYYYRQIFHNRDYSLQGLIDTAIQLRKVNRHYDRYAVVFESEKDILTSLEEIVREELLTKYRIKELEV